MADFLLSVGVDVGLSYDQMQKDISDLVTQLNQNPQRVRVGLEIDHSAIERFRTEVANIHNSMGGLGRVTVSPVDTGGLNTAIDGIARLAQSTQGAISTVQTMRAELNSVNAERIQQAIASINGISAEGASALAHSLGEANVRATEVRARLLEAADAEQQLVALQVRGTNEAGHMVNYLMTYNTETGEISRRMVDITARLEDATAAESHRATTVREITDLYRQMHALMRTNANAANTASYAELANQAQLLQDALALARTESISVDEALTRLGTTGATAINGARDAMSAFRLEMEQTGSSGTVNLTTMYNTVAQMQNLLNNNAGYANLATYTNLQTQVNLLAQAIELASNGGMTLEAALTAVGLNGSTAVQNAREAMSAFRAEMSGATAEEERLTMGTAHYQTALDKINTLLRQVRANTEKWTAAKTGKSSADYQVYADQARELENLAQRLSTGTITMREFNAEYSRIRSTASGAETSIKAAGEATQTWTQRVGKLTEKFGTWFSITRVIMAAYRAVREMVSAVVDLDTAMTELKKVTDETDATYERFLNNAATRAKQLGATMSDIVTASTDFARLGYTIGEAESLADAAIVYKNVGDGIEDINTAAESIIATMQAFGVEATNVMSIVDKFNEVGNNFAISSKGVGDALLRSAAAMKSANNTLDETIALATASNTIVQDPEKVGTTLKTVSMYLRAAKTEADEAGESTEGMANSVSELRNEILALTGNKVDIQIDDDTFKSTYQILQELSKVWHELSDVSQANILEMVGGKRNANVVAAILENFSVAEKALQTSAESAGSALVENEKYLDSIEGHMSKFSATFEEFSTILIDSELVKGVVDVGTGLLNILTTISNIINALGGLKTVLVAITGVVLTMKAGAIFGAEGALYRGLSGLLGILPKLGGFLTNIVKSLGIYVTTAFKAEKGTKLAALSMNGFSSAMNKAGIAATALQIKVALLMIAITAVVTAISKYNQKQEEARQAAADSASAISDNTTKLNEYKDTILDLRSALDTNTLSETEAYDARKQLVEIEQSLIELFGKEAEGIDLVTGSINDQIAALSGLSEAQWNAYKQENSGAIDDAVKLFTSPDKVKARYTTRSTGNVSIPNRKYIYEMMESLYPSATEAEIKQYATEYYNTLITKIKEAIPNAKIENYDTDFANNKGYFNISDLGDDIYDYLSAYESIYNIVEETTKSYVGAGNYTKYVGVALEGISDDINGIKGDIEENEEIFNTYVEGLLLYEDEYAGAYSKALAAKKEYDKAVLDGDNKAAADAIKKMQDAQQMFTDAGWDNEAVNLYMQDFFDAFNTASEKHKGIIEVEAVLTNANDAGAKAAKEAIKAFENESGKIDMSVISSAGIDAEHGGIADKEQADAYAQLKSLADQYNISVEDLVGVMSDLKLVTLDYADAADTAADSAPNLKTAIEGIDSLSTGLDQLNKIYADIFNGEEFDFSALVSDDFTNAFGGLGDAYYNFLEVVANSPKDIDACQTAFDNLATAYLINSDALSDVTEENKNVVIAMLEQMGVANAAAIVDAQLAYNKERLKYTTGDYVDMTYEEILELYNECEAASVTQQVLAELAIAKMFANENGIRTESDIDQLIALANTAKATEASLNNLEQAKALMAQAESYKAISDKAQADGDGYNFQKNLAAAQSYWSKAQEYLNKPLEYNQIDPNQFKANYTGGSSTRSAQETWFDKQLAEHQHLVAMEQETEDEYLAWLSGAYPKAYQEGIIELKDFYKYQEEVFEGLRDLFKDKLGDIEHEISMRENYDGESDKIISMYEKLMKDVEKEIAAARAQGLDDTDDYIQELQKKWQGYYDSVTDIRESAEEDAKDAIDELVDYRIDMIKQEIEDEKDALDKKLDYLKEFYDKQKEMLQDQYDEEKYLEEQSEKRKTVTDLKSELAMLENDDSAWAQKRKLELQEELATAEDDLGDFEDEHALDMALDALDNAYNAQEAQIQAEMDALDERLNDPEALFNQALNDIKTNTGNLYQEMLEYNRKHGTGNDEDVKDKYEDAYKALLEYEDVYGEPYKGIVLPNSTNYKPENGSWDDSKISGTNPDNQPKEEPKKEEPKKEEPKNTAPSLSKGSTITVKKSATHFGSKSNGVRMASFVPGGSYTVYQTSGNQVLIGRNGVYTGWINKSDIVGYAKGTKNATAGLHSLDELGSEYLFTSTDGNKYRVLSSGDKVLNARATDFLYEFANGGGEILEKIIKSAFGSSLFDRIQPVVNNNNIDMGDVIVQGSANDKTVSEIRRAQRDNLSTMLKEFNKLNK